MSKITLESENEVVKRTLESAYCPEPIRHARQRQDEILSERLQWDMDNAGVAGFKIADIGCGNGYHAVQFAQYCLLYHGFEISPAMAKSARALWKKEGIDNAQVFVGDAAEVGVKPAFYDLVLCLYFTPGNIRDRSDDLSLYSDAYLDQNPRFIRVLSRFYAGLKTGGAAFLTLYKNTPEAEAAQIDFYEHTGQRVMTPLGSRFVATAEGFWSARWTKDSVRSNLTACGIRAENIAFYDLNPIAWLVEVKK